MEHEIHTIASAVFFLAIGMLFLLAYIPNRINMQTSPSNGFQLFVSVSSFVTAFLCIVIAAWMLISGGVL